MFVKGATGDVGCNFTYMSVEWKHLNQSGPSDAILRHTVISLLEAPYFIETPPAGLQILTR